MKRLFSVVLAMVLTVSLHAQSRLVGDWQGKIDAGGRGLTLVLHVKETNGKLSATFDSPDQKVTGIPISSIGMSGDTVNFEVAMPPVKYIGMMMGTSIVGMWQQGGGNIPLELNKTDNPVQLNRPQTPKPPYIYNTEDVIFTNADKSITYGATITIPNTTGTKPAILLVSGSGPQNRDEELMGHKPFAVIADYLTDKGYIVLRVDDRGVAQTTGDRTNTTTADYIKDASAAIDYLKTRKEVNPKKIGIMGHSEGGIIAPAVAVERKDIDFIILMAGPGVKSYELMEDQAAAGMEVAGVAPGIVADYRKLYRGMEQSAITATSETEARNKMMAVIDAWKKTAKKESITLVGVDNTSKSSELVDGFLQLYNSKWFNYFLKYDPQPVLQKVSCKVLALNGSKDIQVLPKSNLEGIRQSLAKSKAKDVTIKELPGLNHLFQECTKCSAQEYAELDQTISPTALQEVKDWLDKKVK